MKLQRLGPSRNRGIHLIVILMFIISLSFMSVQQIEMRETAQNSSKISAEKNFKSVVTKPRHVASTLRIVWTPTMIFSALILLLVAIVLLLTTPVYKSLSSISLIIKRLFLMPIKFTSTSI
ncbi:MAG: hypothetical protein P0Y55_09205 [Candidatus Cohnella colombiensis]|uniref:Uncharacterized protein n=1 Tax=Candidatus Cohnella colombiensis TaxID=3121368 RepID=A0AA95EZ59_9BACL|nr:MAG: hypothetical protein P0Y55_09205 [Cohnella sp.]